MTKLVDLLSVLHEDLKLSSPIEIRDAIGLIIRVQEMDGGERDTIRAAFKNGPIYDGDVPSKSGRDSLMRDGLISKVVVKGEEGFNACTYLGGRAYRLIEAGA